MSMQSPYGVDDGNFKKGRFKPVAVVVGALLVLGGGVATFFAVSGEKAKMGKEEIAKERKSTQLLSRAEQLPKWRAWAANDAEARLQQDGIVELAWAKDPEGLKIIIEKGLSSKDHGVRGTAAAAIFEFGSPAADAAREPLLTALKDADASDKPQISWALVVLKEPRAFDTVLTEYRAGRLSTVQKLDGFRAFDPELMAEMVSVDKLATLVGDENGSVRQLVATVLSRTGDPKWTSELIKLVKDKEIEIAREAAVGLGKIANEAAMGPLVDALARADKSSRQRFLEALRDGVGTRGLVIATKTVSKEKPETENFQLKQLFDMMADLQDPRGADALVEYLGTNPRPHWRTEAAMRLAEVGDVRAAAHLGWRMKQDPLKIYAGDDLLDMELRRDDNERVYAARMLADLAILHPEAKAQLLKDAEDGVYEWATRVIGGLERPHANAMRFLAAAGSAKSVAKFRSWADPNVPLPKEGASPPFPDEWATAQSALRYLGWTKDPTAWPILEKQMTRRPAKLNASWESLFQGGLTILGMTLRAVGVGASQGFAQWGDARAYPILVKHIEDPLEHEQSRGEACFSLAFVATDEQMKEVAKKVKEAKTTDKAGQFLRGCYMETLLRHPVPAATGNLVDMLSPEAGDLEVRHQIARAIGLGGITPDIREKLLAKLKEPSTRADAALSLLLGGDAESARKAMASYNEAEPQAAEELKEMYNKTFSYWSDKNYENGDLARWVENAEAVRHVRVHDVLVDWPRQLLGRNLTESIRIDNGPRSMTRVQLRVRLYQDAKAADAGKRDRALSILKFVGERGVLMALRSEPPPLGPMAHQAFFEVMNPKVVEGSLPKAPERKSSDMAPGQGATILPR